MSTPGNSHEPRKKPSYFPLNPGWLIGILIVVHYNHYIVGWYNPLYNPTKQGFFCGSDDNFPHQPFEDVSPMFKMMIFQPVMLRKLFSRVPTMFFFNDVAMDINLFHIDPNISKSGANNTPRIF